MLESPNPTYNHAQTMWYRPLLKAAVLCRREVEKMKDAVNAAAGGDGVPTRRIAGDAGREYILQMEDETKAKAALDAGLLHMQSVPSYTMR